jgi:cytochrome c oxidase assembly factor CtaG
MREIAQSWLESKPSSIAISFVLLATAAIYLRGWYGLRRAGRYPISGWRLGAFMAGGFSVWAVVSPLAGLDRQFLIAHMVEHLLLMTLAPPLLLLGRPQLCLERGLPQFLARSARLLFDWPPVERLRRVFANPAVCFLSGTGVLLVWHLPPSLELAMRSDTWHAIELASFLLGGILFWWPLARCWSIGGRALRWWHPLYLFLGTLPCDALSAFLAFCDRVVYPCYLNAQPPGSLSALQDQEYAGALMWVAVTIAYLIPAVIVTAALLDHHRPRVRLEALPSGSQEIA